MADTSSAGPGGPAFERHAPRVAALCRAVFESPGCTPPATRAAAGIGSLPEPAGSYTAKVHDASYRITDDDFAELAAAGLVDDEIFELTVAAAVAAALRGFDAGIRAVREQS